MNTLREYVNAKRLVCHRSALLTNMASTGVSTTSDMEFKRPFKRIFAIN